MAADKARFSRYTLAPGEKKNSENPYRADTNAGEKFSYFFFCDDLVRTTSLVVLQFEKFWAGRKIYRTFYREMQRLIVFF